MPTTPLLPFPEGLEITSISEGTEEVVVRVTSHRRTSQCPVCGVPSSTIHSYYRRKPRDLPCAGRPIRLLLTVKKFVCRQTKCPRKIFVERLPDLIEVSSRLTKRLRSAVQDIGFATCKVRLSSRQVYGLKTGIPLRHFSVSHQLPDPV
jgi:transposase